MRLFLLFLLCFPGISHSQTDYDMDELARNIPTSKTNSVEEMARYFVGNIPDDRGRIRAIFAWITLNVKYLDTNNGSEIWATPEHIHRQRPEQVLKNRTAVCQGYANLFQALAKAAGMECQVIPGIVKDADGTVMRYGHAWVAAEIQQKWQLFDPTWSLKRPGEGWLVNDHYFMMAPELFVQSHLPDDPAWQLLENPLTEAEFRENDGDAIAERVKQQADPVFSYRDTLNYWISMDSIARVFSSENRILQFNGSNQRILFALGQSYWRLFFDAMANLDSLADRSIMNENILLDTAYFSAQLSLMEQYHQRARALFGQITDPQRITQTSKFYTPEDVAVIAAQLQGAMWTAVFEAAFSQSSQQISEATLSALYPSVAAADQAYAQALDHINCTKLPNTCFEIWHNLSLVHYQLAERQAIYAEHLLAERNADKFLKSIESSLKKAQQYYERAEAETRQLLLIPPPYAFVRERLTGIRQGLLTLKADKLRWRRVALTPSIETALTADEKPLYLAKTLTSKLEPIVDDLTQLAQETEDAYGDLGTDFCDATLYNLHQEGYAMRFNLSSLYYRMALDEYYTAVGNKTLAREKENIRAMAQNALPWLKEAELSYEFLKKSRKVPAESLSQRLLQINKLSKSIRDFLKAL